MKTSVSRKRVNPHCVPLQGRNRTAQPRPPARTRALPVVTLNPDALTLTRGPVAKTLERVHAGFTEGEISLYGMGKSLGGVFEYGLNEERSRICCAGMLLAMQFKALAEAEAAGRLTLDHPAHLDLCTAVRRAAGALLAMSFILEGHAPFAADAGRYVVLATDLKTVLDDITNTLKVRYGVAREKGGAR